MSVFPVQQKFFEVHDRLISRCDPGNSVQLVLQIVFGTQQLPLDFHSFFCQLPVSYQLALSFTWLHWHATPVWLWCGINETPNMLWTPNKYYPFNLSTQKKREASCDELASTLKNWSMFPLHAVFCSCFQSIHKKMPFPHLLYTL